MSIEHLQASFSFLPSVHSSQRHFSIYQVFSVHSVQIDSITSFTLYHFQTMCELFDVFLRKIVRTHLWNTYSRISVYPPLSFAVIVQNKCQKHSTISSFPLIPKMQPKAASLQNNFTKNLNRWKESQVSVEKRSGAQKKRKEKKVVHSNRLLNFKPEIRTSCICKCHWRFLILTQRHIYVVYPSFMDSDLDLFKCWMLKHIKNLLISYLQFRLW